jgi:hypothetical protein
MCYGLNICDLIKIHIEILIPRGTVLRGGIFQWLGHKDYVLGMAQCSCAGMEDTGWTASVSLFFAPC